MVVLLKSKKSLMTVEGFYDFVHRSENESRSFELVRGEVIEVSRPRRPHGVLCGNAGRLLGNYTFRKKKGYITNDTGIILDRDPDTVRGADIAYYEDVVEYDDLPEKWGDTIPRLVVEVVSPNDTASYILGKVGDYFRSGVEIIWLIDPDLKRVNIYSKTEGVISLNEKDTITGGDVLPGFKCKVADFFVLPETAKKPKRKRT